MDNQSTNKQSVSGIFMLTLCSFIWGTAFIAQSVGAQYMGPLTFTGLRSILASMFLFPCIFLFDKFAGKSLSFWGNIDSDKKTILWRGGVICGFVLTVASLFQQIGMAYTTVGKGGFITSLYIVIVPLFGRFFLGRMVNILQWISVLIASVGMYFICLSEEFTVNTGDMFILASAICFALHILVVEHFVHTADGLRLSFFQFLTSSVINCILMFVFEEPSWQQIDLALTSIFYAGIMSSGIAYTLQIVGQKNVNVVLSSILLSLESVFAVLSGWFFLNQLLSAREIFGCVLVFCAIMLAQVPPQFFKFKK